MKVLRVTIVSTLIAAVLISCSKKPELGVKSVEESVRTIEHAMGTTEIKGKPEKIVILTNEGTEALLALGVNPVGAVKSWTGDPWYKHITEDMAEVVNVGTESQVNLELIASLQPDLIIGNTMRQEDVYTQLSAIAPTVFSERLRGDWRNNFNFYAYALDLEGAGKDVLARFDAKVKEIADLAGDKLSTEISIVRFLDGQTRIYLQDTFSGTILKQIGFQRPEAQRIDEFMLKIEKERMAVAEGDVIFYFTYDDGDGKGSERQNDWLEDPLFKALKASQAGKVFEVDDAIWNTAGGVIAAELMLEDLEAFIHEGKI